MRDIPMLYNIRDSHHAILLCLHGFGGDKNSSVIAALADRLDGYGIGVLAFDWPAHGESTEEDAALRVENCLKALEKCLQYIGKCWDKPVACFATSFGGYLATLYRNEHPKAFYKTILRSPALRMDKVFRGIIAGSDFERMLSGDKVTIGFERKMNIGRELYDDFLRYNAYDQMAPNPDEVLILQGDRDDVVAPEDIRLYAERNHIRLEWFYGTDHRYKKDGELMRILDLTQDFLIA